ncbi:MAG: glycosyltransferase family 4 protein [Sumerlaeia bacterium]
MRHLILTTEPLPLPGLPATGAGLRAWALFRGLQSAGVGEVAVAFAADAIRGRSVDRSAWPEGVRTFERSGLAAFIADLAPDTVILQHWGLGRDLPEIAQPLAVDLAGPHLLERCLWGSRHRESDLAEKLAVLRRADHVVCSGEYQRRYFLGFLAMAGWDMANGDLCPAIAFSVDPDLAPPNDDRDGAHLVLGGFFLPWQDPSWAIETTLEIMDEAGAGHLTIIGGAHPSGDVSAGRHDALLERLKSHSRVTLRGPMAFDDYARELTRFGAALDLMPRNPERELAFPTRTVQYLAAGLPVLHNDYDELAPAIAEAQAGWALRPGDREGLARALRTILTDRDERERRADNTRRLVRERYSWDRTIEPLAAWCRNPERRPAAAAPGPAAAGPEVMNPEPESKPRRRSVAGLLMGLAVAPMALGVAGVLAISSLLRGRSKVGR